MNLSTQLQAIIQKPHQEIEKLPFSQSLVNGSVNRATYCQMLVQMAAIHETLESLLERSTIAGSIYSPSMARTVDLRNDLNALGSQDNDGLVLRLTLEFGILLHEWANHRPAALLGVLYVLEGSRMGSLVLSRTLAHAFNVPVSLGHGIDYHVRDMAQRVPQWKQFKGTLDSMAMSPDEQGDVLHGAERTFETLLGIYGQLSKSTPNRFSRHPSRELVAQ